MFKRVVQLLSAIERLAPHVEMGIVELSYGADELGPYLRYQRGTDYSFWPTETEWEISIDRKFRRGVSDYKTLIQNLIAVGILTEPHISSQEKIGLIGMDLLPELLRVSVWLYSKDEPDMLLEKPS